MSVKCCLPVVPPPILELGEVPVLGEVEYGHVDDILEAGALGGGDAIPLRIQVLTHLQSIQK